MIPRLFRPYRGDVKNWKRGRVWVVRTSYSISPARLKSPGFRTSPASHPPLHATIIHPHSLLIRSHQHPKSHVNRPIITRHLPYLRTRKTPILTPDFVSGKQRIIVIKYFASIVIFIPIFTQVCLDRRIIASKKRHRNA